MKKRLPKKLQLTTETLRHLYSAQMRNVEGGADQQDTGSGYTQEASYCNPCTTAETLFPAYC